MKTLKLHYSLATKWLAFQIIGLGLILCLVGLYQYYSIRAAIFEDIENSGRAVSQSIREMLLEDPELFNTKTLKPVLVRLATNVPDIKRIRVIDQSHHIIADSNNTAIGETVNESKLLALLQERGELLSFFEMDGEKYLRLSYTIEGRYDPLRKNSLVGVLMMDLHLSHGEQLIAAQLKQVMLVMAGLLFMFWAIQYALMRRGFLRWLRLLTSAAERFGNGDFSVRAQVKSGDELGQLAAAFNQMATDVESADKTLKTEIVERKRIEEELKANEMRMAEAQRIAHLGSWEFDVATGRVKWSDELWRIFGLDQQEFGLSFEECLAMVHPDDHPHIKSIKEESQQSKKDFAYDYRIIQADGTARVFRANGRVIYDDHGQMVKVTGTDQDITEQKRAEESLRESEERYELAVEGSNDGLWDWNMETNEVYFSPRWKSMLGYEDHQVENLFESWESALHPDDRAHAFATIEAYSDGRTSQYALEHRLRHKDGTYRWILARAAILRDANAKPYRMSGSHTDITERKQLELDLTGARDAALESTRLKSEFLANMSHEIRTPMNGVIGMTGLLLDTELTAEQRDFTETINSSAGSLMTVINDILDFSKIEAGMLHFEKLDFALLPAVEGSVELLAERAQAKGIELASLIESDVPVALRGDVGRLRQVLTNLIGNAVKFTEEGEVVVGVTKEGDTDTHAKLRFCITDTGIGISAEAQRKLFQPFVQADGSTTRKYGGTGLGLAISKQLVELMGGEIGVQSTPGAGSTFWFTAILEKQSAATAVCAPVKGKLDGKRVLIVDDNATNRKILVHQTVSWGMIPVEAESGRRALELLRAAVGRREPFDLAILDLMMPEMDGFDVARQIEADESIASVRLMMLTSYGERGHGEQAREAGVAAYLAKPVRQTQLFDCLTSVMGLMSAPADEVKLSAADAAMLITKHSLSEAKTMSDKRILVAEDNVVNQKVAMRQLGKLGYAAATVANGREALEALETTAYDLIFMDCQMPLMDGYEATAAIRASETDGRRIPIIAMTAHALAGERAKCLAAGMDDYLSKPVKLEELEKVLANWLTVSSALTEEASTLRKLEKDETPPVDMERLYLAMGEEPEEVQEILDIYLEQMEGSLRKLDAAITLGDAGEVGLIAHNCSGVSANCGMVAVVAPLRELERMGREGQLSGAAQRRAEVEKEFGRVKIFLQEQLTQLV